MEDGDSELFLKCHNTDELYFYYRTSFYQGQACSKDPHFYQACDNKLDEFRVTNDQVLCKNWLCQPEPFDDIDSVSRLGSELCNDEYDCMNTNLDEFNCENITTLRSGRKVKSENICNDVCDDSGCEDEANCNNRTYGLYCNSTQDWPPINVERYVPPTDICDGKNDCDNDEDEINCQV